jgi:hypothetical protein
MESRWEMLSISLGLFGLQDQIKKERRRRGSRRFFIGFCGKLFSKSFEAEAGNLVGKLDCCFEN